MLTTCIFDLSEVYLNGQRGSESTIAPLVGLTPVEVKAHFKHGPHLEEFFHGQISEREYWTHVIHHGGWEISPETLEDTIRENFTEIPGTRKIIERLRTNGYRLGLLSIHAKEWIDYCEARYDYHRLFDRTCYSFECGVSKPDARAYQHILERLSVQAKECVFVDDKSENTQAAQALGMEAIVFESAEQLERDLISLGVRL